MGVLGGKFYIDDSDNPDLTLSEAVVAVLFDDGGFAYLRDEAGLRFEMDEYEADELPTSCLERLATASRQLADRYDDQPATRRVVREFAQLRGDKWEHGQEVLETQAEDVRLALLQLAELCDLARNRGEPLWVSL